MKTTLATFVLLLSAVAFGQDADSTLNLPLSPGTFIQQKHIPYTQAQGLPDNDVLQVRVNQAGTVTAVCAASAAAFDPQDQQWHAVAQPALADVAEPSATFLRQLRDTVGAEAALRDVARLNDEWAVAADAGLFLWTKGRWRQVLPRQGAARWAPVDVRAVAYDAEERLWFAAPQGVGCRIGEEDWRLFTGAEGLPFNDFTCMAAGPRGVWFGTTNGAIHFDNNAFSFRHGRRWLLDNHVRDIAVDAEGNAWFATCNGVSCIVHQPVTLLEKAAFFEEEIEAHHRRTPFGYIAPATLSAPGDKNNAVPVFTDNDGHFTGLYLGAASLRYAVLGGQRWKEDAEKAFRAVAFLREVTQGGTHPAPPGFIARAIMPASGPDPNPQFDLAYDQRRNRADALWKIIQPRWPVDASGQWYWKNDSSSDELDGHFFGFALYYDLVCANEEEREAVRAAVRPILDHLLTHGYNLVDYDGQPTRWGRFSPDDMNRNAAWCEERGLNSLSILTYLSIGHHITDDARYREHYLKLAWDHGYAMNGMTQPKPLPGPDSAGHQPDDNMAFMNYYHLIRYETDPELLGMYYYAIEQHWKYEQKERNPFAAFVYAACCLGKVRRDHWGETDLSPTLSSLEDAVETLKRYPLDLVDWPISNAHRLDIAAQRDALGNPIGKGSGHDGRVLPIDERSEVYWGWDPWTLTGNGQGLTLRDGAPYLLAYYLGRHHGHIGE